MFDNKADCVRELVDRAIDSSLNADDALKATYFMLKAYREDPKAYGNFRDMEEPLDITDAFQWNGTGPKWLKFWHTVCSAIIDTYFQRLVLCDIQGTTDELLDEQDELDAEVMEPMKAKVKPAVKATKRSDRKTATKKSAPKAK